VESHVDTAAELMQEFAARTGLTGSEPERRYLWTDAFAVCNLLGLAAATDDPTLTTLARRLVDHVHEALGRFRPDDVRTGRLPGASEAHPTRGGLRIGKPLPERAPGAPIDERLEWDRDGQYFHYLTKWMHALDRVARATGDSDCHRWACELADTANRAFAYGPAGARRMHWKMSTDLSRPLVASMGQHDPLDGWITYVQLATPAPGRAAPADATSLRAAADDFHRMLAGADVATTDPLGLGGLLTDAARVAQLARAGANFGGEGLLEVLLAAALRGLDAYIRGGDWRLPATHRLGFRELGLVIGLAASDWIRAWARPGELSAIAVDLLERLAARRDLGEEMRAFWLEPRHRATTLWTEHRDINDTMLATSLAPAGFLELDLRAPR